MVDLSSVAISFAVAAPAYCFAGLTWMESRKQRRLLETVTKALPYVRGSRRRKRPPRPVDSSTRTSGTVGNQALALAPRPPTAAQVLEQRREERKRLELEFRKEREQWRRQKDMAKAIGWFIDRLGEGEEEDEEE